MSKVRAPEGICDMNNTTCRTCGAAYHTCGTCDNSGTPWLDDSCCSPFCYHQWASKRIEELSDDIMHYANAPQPTVVAHSALKLEAHSLKNEVDRLRGLVKDSYLEGHYDGRDGVPVSVGKQLASWNSSNSAEQLKGGEA